jgi:hypothetical protein
MISEIGEYVDEVDKEKVLKIAKEGNLEQLEIFGSCISQLIITDELAIDDAISLWATASRRAFLLAREINEKPEMADERKELRKLGREYRKVAAKATIAWET